MFVEHLRAVRVPNEDIPPSSNVFYRGSASFHLRRLPLRRHLQKHWYNEPPFRPLKLTESAQFEYSRDLQVAVYTLCHKQAVRANADFAQRYSITVVVGCRPMSLANVRKFPNAS